MMFDEFFHISSAETEDGIVGTQMTLAIIRDDFPWIYEAGMEAIKIIKSRVAVVEKEKAIRAFTKIVEFSFEHPMMRDKIRNDKHWHMMGRELPHLLEHAMHRALRG